MNKPHKISKLIFEVALEGDQNQAKQQQSEIEQLLLKHIADALDKALSNADTQDDNLIIDKLEIDLDIFDFKNDSEKFFKEITEKVEQEIRIIHRTKTIHEETKQNKQGFNNDLELTLNQSDNTSQELIEQTSAESKNDVDLILYILRNGHLPWWADFEEKVNIKEFFKQYVKNPNNQISVLLKNELVNPVFRKRMINYLTEKELVDCVDVLTPKLIYNKKLTVEKSKSSSSFKEEYFDLLLQLAPQRTNDQIVRVLKPLLELLKENEVPIKSINFETLPLKEKILSRLKLIQSSTEEIQSFELIDPAENSKEATKEQQSEEVSNEEDKTEQQTNINDEEIENSIEVNNAGLVLILSFLSRFFENIGIAKNKEFISVEKQHYAVYLLHYIASGEENIPQEHELFFEKLICGIDVNEVLKPCATIDKSHIAEAEELLKAVIENWKALKSSSPQTLQTAFLQRSGYLIQRDDGAWSLHIERQTIDILLDRIPWTVSMNRLPFSNIMIYTEW